MTTRRQKLVALLEEGESTAKQLAEEMAMRLKDLIDDLDHVAKSVGKRFKVRPALCTGCDFVFRSRAKWSTPSRCPKCRSERIVGPWLSVSGA